VPPRLDQTPGPAPHRLRRPPLVLTHQLRTTRVLLPLTGAAIALVGLLWAVGSVLLPGMTPALDTEVAGAVADTRTTGTIALARVVTHLGDLWVVATVGAGLVLLARWRAGRWDAAKLVAVVVGGALIITAVSKSLTARPRPDGSLTSTVSLAFPSGHASRAAVVYLLIAWLATRWATRIVVRWGVPLLALSMMLATGWSRLLLGAHWPTDVLAGFALGGCWLAVVLGVTRPVPRAGPPGTQ
jgi:membrane-associated phospholipid phosphatase